MEDLLWLPGHVRVGGAPSLVQDGYNSVGGEVKITVRVGVVAEVLESGEGEPDMIPWWRTVAASRALQGRARELADQLSAELAQAMAATGTAEPELAAALTVAAYRTVHLQAVRRVLAGEVPATVAARQPGRIRSALSAVDASIDADAQHA